MRNYDGHLMAFTINKNLIFIDSMEFANSSLDILVKKFSDNASKYLSQELCGDLLKLVKQKGMHPHEYMDSFKKFFTDKLPGKFIFYSSLKNECISNKIIYRLIIF